LLDFYHQLPEPREGEEPDAWQRRLQMGLGTFQKQVRERYTEGTLQRLVECHSAPARRAAALALGMLGTMQSNQALAGRLHDDDAIVRQMAGEALWNLWYRGDTEANSRELLRLMRLRDRDKALTGLDALIGKAPRFAEAYNQRAILFFQKKDFARSSADCEKAIELNPVHFGAYSGLGQCQLNLRKPRAALRAFRQAYEINPNLQGMEETIRELESVLGEEGKRDDKK
jgi:tetratricopeptide (TPR) repeat protein